MKKTILLLTILLLINRVATAQEVSPLIVETLDPEPTLVKTADIFSQNYLVTHYCITGRGEKVEIRKNRMEPNNISFAPFTTVKLQVDKLPKSGNVCSWRYTYFLQIVDKEKIVNKNKESDVAIPPITFYWIVKQAGIPEEDLKVFEQQTEKRFVTYHSTIPDSVAFLDIRENIELGDFKKNAFIFRGVAVLFTLAALAIITFIVKRFVSRKVAAAAKTDTQEEKTVVQEESPVRLSRRAARKQLMEKLKAIKVPDGGIGVVTKFYAKTFYEVVRPLLMAEIPELTWSFTPTEIRDHIQKMPGGARKEILLQLADRLCVYQECLDAPQTSLDFVKEIVLLTDLFKSLRWIWIAELKYKINKRLART